MGKIKKWGCLTPDRPVKTIRSRNDLSKAIRYLMIVHGPQTVAELNKKIMDEFNVSKSLFLNSQMVRYYVALFSEKIGEDRLGRNIYALCSH